MSEKQNVQLPIHIGNELTTFPVACPHCAAPQGYPYRVETSRESHDHVNVSMQCKDCQHSWIVQRLGGDGPPA